MSNTFLIPRRVSRIRVLKQTTLWLVVTMLFSPAMAISQEQEAEPESEDSSKAIELEPITTTGTARSTRLLDAPSDVDVVGGEEKRREQGASLGDSLDQLAGVSSIGTGSQVGKPVIRGLSGNRVRILANGVGVNHQQFGVRHSPNIEPYFADRLEVVRGASSVLYGSDAIGGAINVVPFAVPFSSTGTSSVNGYFVGDYESMNHQRTYATRVNIPGERFGLTAGIVDRSAGNLTTPRLGTFPETGIVGRPNFSGELDHTDFDQRNAELAVAYRSDASRFEARYQHWEDEHNFLLPPPRNLPNGIGIGQNLENDTLQLTGEWDIGVNWTLAPSLSWVSNLRQSNPGPGGTTRATGSTREFLPQDIVIDIERDSYVARLEARHAAIAGFGKPVGRLGVEYRYEIQDSLGKVALTPGGKIENVSVFGLEEWRHASWILNAGLRYDQRSQSADPNRTRDSAVIPSDPGLRENDYSVVSGSLGAVYKLSDEWSLATNIGRAYRAPDLFELYANGVHGGVAAQQRGNPDLDEEFSLNTDVGIRYRSERLLLKATVYRNRVSDYIYLQNTQDTNPGGLPIYETEQADATLTGGDVSLRWFVTEHLEVAATAEAVRGEFDESGAELPLLPADQITLSATQRFIPTAVGPEFHARADIRYAADKDSAGVLEPFSQFDNTPFGASSTDAYTLLDLSIGMRWHAGARLVHLNVGVDNVFDEDYRDFLDTYKGYALSPGRNYWVKLRWPFGA